MSEVKAVEFEAQITRVQTLADGTVRWVVDFDERYKEQGIEGMRHVPGMIRGVVEFEQI
ncbi:MAG: hypothetical protein HN929_09150 [Chloroflexi bacterium]|jgi:hypothetical protein|nr:hypothetical protein [Chloroflexota bacterium]